MTKDQLADARRKLATVLEILEVIDKDLADHGYEVPRISIELVRALLQPTKEALDSD